MTSAVWSKKEDLSPQAVVAELRRLGLPVYRTGEVIGTDERLRELFRLARLGGWSPDQEPRARHINLGRLIAATRTQADGYGATD